VKIWKSVLALASATAMVGAFAGTAGASHPNVTTTNVANSTITCNSQVGSLSFLPALTLYGGTVDTTPAGTVTVKAAVTGCTTPATGVLIESGATAGVIHSAHSSCNGLSGLSTGTTGPLVTKWKAWPGHSNAITPTSSTLNITQTNGAQFNNVSPPNPVGDRDTWGGVYGLFQVGTDVAHGGTTAPTVTGAFTGGDSGHTSTLDTATGQDVGGIALACLLTTGVKILNIGIGGTTSQ